MTRSDQGPDELYDPQVEPLMRRIRRAIVREDDENVRRAMSALRNSHPLGYGLIGPQKGPFDEPPTEAVELDPESLPWELREAGGDVGWPKGDENSPK